MGSPFFKKNRNCLIDLSHRCALECPACQRQMYYKPSQWKSNNEWLNKIENKVPGKDLPLESVEMILNNFEEVSLGGQLSDPIHYPHFIELLKMCKDRETGVKVQTASSHKPESFFMKAFETYDIAVWQFGIDGLPSESHKYRKHQDGEKLFKIMCEGAKILKRKPIWQYIVFNYNEDHIEEAKQMAKDNNLGFVLMKSARWLKGFTDHLIPSKKNRLDSTYDEKIKDD